MVCSILFPGELFYQHAAVSRTDTPTVRKHTHIVKDFCLPFMSACFFHLISIFISQQPYFALGSGNTIVLRTNLRNAGDDAFLPRLSLHFPSNIHYNKVLQNVSLHTSDRAERANICFI